MLYLPSFFSVELPYMPCVAHRAFVPLLPRPLIHRRVVQPHSLYGRPLSVGAEEFAQPLFMYLPVLVFGRGGRTVSFLSCSQDS